MVRFKGTVLAREKMETEIYGTELFPNGIGGPIQFTSLKMLILTESFEFNKK